MVEAALRSLWCLEKEGGSPALHLVLIFTDQAPRLVQRQLEILKVGICGKYHERWQIGITEVAATDRKIMGAIAR
jgi:hypothetical protein